jgi:hypothetical protein
MTLRRDGQALGNTPTDPNASRGQPAGLATPWVAPGLRRVVAAAGTLYLLAVWLDAAGTTIPDRVLAPPLRLFVQVAELFPNASPYSIEWRARGWRCDRARYEELDVRPYFPIHRDDKESRFDRAMFFYHRDGRVLAALDAYLTSAQTRLHPDARIGGVMLLSLRVPIPPLGTTGARHERQPIASYPPSVARQYWYTTGIEERTRRCAESP